MAGREGGPARRPAARRAAAPRPLAARPGAAVPPAAPDPAALTPLPESFFARPSPEVARDLVGCFFACAGVGGRLVEVEAYAPGDPASHSCRGRTARNAAMFGPPGRLYVYFTYGMHFCVNLVCEEEGVGSAVLLRALEPLWGLAEMAARRGPVVLGRDGRPDPRLLCSGPARLAQALGLDRRHDGCCALAPPFLVAARLPGDRPRVVATPRIGVNGEPRPWRFVDARSPFLSRPLGAGGGR